MIRRLLSLAAGRRLALTASVGLGFLAAAASIALMAMSGFLISSAALHPPILDLAVAIVAVRFFSIARGVFRYVDRLVSHDLALRLLADLRVRLYSHLEPLAPAGLEEFRAGELLARMVGDIEALQDFFLRAVAPPLVAALVLGLVVGIVWPIAPASVPALVVPFVVAGLLLPMLGRRIARPWAATRSRLGGELSVEIVELLRGAPEIVAFGRRSERLGRIRTIDSDVSRAGLRLANAGSALDAAVVPLAIMAVAGVLALAMPSAGGVYLATLALATLVAFEAVQPLPDASRRLEQSLAAAARLFAIYDKRPPVIDRTSAPAAAAGVIQLEKAWLRYRAGGPWALAGIDLRLDPGRKVALIGPSGSGKTSVANVLLRFRELDRGRATLEGRDLGAYDQHSVRRVIGLCEQDPHLFNATILDNIRLARPSATIGELEAAAAQARVLDWIGSLPQGWETRVGELGAAVSGGQRQRISLARAILADFPILILDEPTANLDRSLADALMGDFLRTCGDRSLLLITHRLEGLDSMDEIVVLEEGRVVERGSPVELIAARGRYAEMRAMMVR
jgi:thiol reductant ABC exporter CydC subunit